MKLPPLYPIIDPVYFAATPDPPSAVVLFVEEMLKAGAMLIQYRDKSNDPHRMLACAKRLRSVIDVQARFIMNDRLDLCLASDADGVHLGQDDLSPEAAHKVFSQVQDEKRRIIGFSTHSLEQVREADLMPVDYIAVGPVFVTASKVNPDPMIGLEGVRQAREATGKPLVAIGGITRDNCRQVRDAGADSVAVISDLLESPAKAVEAFLRVLE